MMKVRNLGRKSLEEVINKLAMMGLSLSSDDNNCSTPTPSLSPGTGGGVCDSGPWRRYVTFRFPCRREAVLHRCPGPMRPMNEFF